MADNLHIVLNNFKNDSRVLKETKSIAQSGLFKRVYIAALWEDGLPEHEFLSHDREVYRVPLRTKTLPKNLFFSIVKYVEWALRVFLAYRHKDIRVVHCHDLEPLPLGLLFKYLCKARLVYDAHELETERSGQTSRLQRLLTCYLERFLIGRVDEVITVSGGIARLYSQRYKITEPHLILNCPPCQAVEKTDKFRQIFDIRKDQKIFLYQGGLRTGRGLDHLLSSFTQIGRDDIVLIVMGYGPLETEVREISCNQKNIFFYPAVAPDEVVAHAAAADVGILPYNNICLNHYYCLPNKLFEYAMAGLPVIVSDLAELKKKVSEHQCGVVLEGESRHDMLAAIDKMMGSDLSFYRNNSLNMAKKYTWEEQEKVLLCVYRNLVGKRG